MLQAKSDELVDIDQVLDAEKREVFEQIIAKYENDWHKDRSTNWQDYLPEDSQLRACLIAELPEIEAEFQGRKGTRSNALSRVNQNKKTGQPSTSESAENSASSIKERAFQAQVNYQQVIREINGGLGDIFVIRDAELNRVVVVKQLQARWLGNRRAERAFQREVKITSMLEHPCVVPVHSVGTTTDGRPFYSMRYVDGQTLQHSIEILHRSNRKDRNLLRSLLTHFIQICKAIAYANDRGIIHRDLKPSNIFIGQFGQTLVLDWGLAKEIGGQSDSLDSISMDLNQTPQGQPVASSTEDAGAIDPDADFYVDSESCAETLRGETTLGDIVGTPAYMSPEQALGQAQEYSVRTDVFGLGSVLFAILAGRPPFVGRDASETISLAAESTADFSVIKNHDALSRGLIAICRKAMSRDSSRRYPDAQALADDLESWLAGDNIAIQSQPILHRLGRAAMRQRTLATAAVLFLVAAIAAIVVSVQAVQAEKTQTLLAENETKASFRVAKNVAEYIAQVYRTTDPIRFDDPDFAGTETSTATSTQKSILDSGYQLINSELSKYPEPHADLLLSLGSSYRDIGDDKRARELLGEAWSIRKELFGENDLKTLECKYQFARLEYELANYKPAEQLLDELISTILGIHVSSRLHYQPSYYRDLDIIGANARYQLAWLHFLQPLGNKYKKFSLERIANSQRLFQEVIQIRKSVLPANDRSIGMAYAGLAAALFCLPNRENEAVIAAQAASKILGQSDPTYIASGMASEYIRLDDFKDAGKLAEVESKYRKIASFMSAQVGENHPLVVLLRLHLASRYSKVGQLPDTETLIQSIRHAASSMPAIRGSRVHLEGLKQYADQLLVQNRKTEAIEVYAEILQCAKERSNQHIELIKQVEKQLTELTPTVDITETGIESDGLKNR